MFVEPRGTAMIRDQIRRSVGVNPSEEERGGALCQELAGQISSGFPFHRLEVQNAANLKGIELDHSEENSGGQRCLHLFVA